MLDVAIVGATVVFAFVFTIELEIGLLAAARAAAAAAAAFARAGLVDVGVVSLMNELAGKYIDLRL